MILVQRVDFIPPYRDLRVFCFPIRISALATSWILDQARPVRVPHRLTQSNEELNNQETGPLPCRPRISWHRLRRPHQPTPRQSVLQGEGERTMAHQSPDLLGRYMLTRRSYRFGFNNAFVDSIGKNILCSSRLIRLHSFDVELRFQYHPCVSSVLPCSFTNSRRLRHLSPERVPRRNCEVSNFT